MTDDGFLTIGRRGVEESNTAKFYSGICRLPFPVPRDHRLRADWQWNQNGTIRLRLGESGRYTVRRDGNAIHVSARQLATTLGATLDGRKLPIDRIDGNDIYISVGDAHAPAA